MFCHYFGLMSIMYGPYIHLPPLFIVSIFCGGAKFAATASMILTSHPETSQKYLSLTFFEVQREYSESGILSD